MLYHESAQIRVVSSHSKRRSTDGENMQTLTLKIEISDEQLKRLDMLARLTGGEREDYAARLVEKGLREETIDELFEPFRSGFQRSGMNESQLSAIMEKELKAVRAEKRKKAGRG